MRTPDVGRLPNLISTGGGGADYAHQITTGPQIFRPFYGPEMYSKFSLIHLCHLEISSVASFNRGADESNFRTT